MSGVEYITVVCDVCGTRIVATADQLGQTVECPDCFTKAVVRRPAVQAPAPKRHIPEVPIDDDEYRLCPGVDQPPPGSRAYQKYVAVVCPVCGTRMVATLDQVGQSITCPDCTIPTTVPPPPEERPKPRHVVVVGDNEYRVFGVDQPPPAGVYIPVVCGVCGTRMHAAEDQVGRQIACPDCGTKEVVPAAAKRVKMDPMAGASEGYGVGQAIRPPDVRVGIDYRTDEPGVGELPSDRARWWRPEKPRPRPRWTFFSGVFTFPGYGSSLACWLGLSAGLVVLGFMALQAIALASVWAGRSMFLGMMLAAVTGVLGLVWFVIASAHMLAIVRDTANGCDEVEDWPEAMFLDWLGASAYVFSSAALSVVPGVAARHVLEWLGQSGEWCVALSMWLGFPVLLVSMLETNSPLRPISLPVLGTLVRRWWAWAVFYLETAAVVLGLDVMVMTAGWAFGPVGIVPAAALTVAAIMVYFRLLGRLTWLVSGTAEEGHG